LTVFANVTEWGRNLYGIEVSSGWHLSGIAGCPFYIILILCTGHSSDNCEIRLDSPEQWMSWQEWPENVLLSVTSVRPEQVRSGTEEATELKHLFGVVLHLPKLSEEDFILSARELLSYRGKPELDVEDDAKQWLHNCSSCTIRTAAHFVTSII
jgi:hypothetical protein